MTTLEPGASDVLTHGWATRPRSTAFLAKSPAAIMTEGLDVLVQLVMAAMTTSPWSSSNSVPSASLTGTSCRYRSPPSAGSSDPAPIALADDGWAGTEV